MSFFFFSFTGPVCSKCIYGAPCVYSCSKFNLVVTISMFYMYKNSEAKYNSSTLETPGLALNPAAMNPSHRTKFLSFTQPQTSHLYSSCDDSTFLTELFGLCELAHVACWSSARLIVGMIHMRGTNRHLLPLATTCPSPDSFLYLNRAVRRSVPFC